MQLGATCQPGEDLLPAHGHTTVTTTVAISMTAVLPEPQGLQLGGCLNGLDMVSK